ncbi:MAG: 7TM domain-containing protein [Candidatus Magasanikbacteria bacterium]
MNTSRYIGYILFFFLLTIGVSLGNITHAQTAEDSVLAEFSLTPVIVSDDSVRVDKKIIFDASKSTISPTSTVTFRWDFGDGFFEVGTEVVHQYVKADVYDVTLTATDSATGEIRMSSKSVLVYNGRVIFIGDSSTAQRLKELDSQAEEYGIAFDIVVPAETQGDYVAEEEFLKLFDTEIKKIQDAETLVFYTSSLRGLQAFTRYWQGVPDEQKIILKNKQFVFISENNMYVAKQGAYQTFEIVRPRHLLLTRPEALGVLASTIDISAVETQLQERGIEFLRIDSDSGKPKWYVLSTLVTSFIKRGISADSIYLILTVPFLAFVVVFARHVVGVNTFGVFTPVIISLTFYILGLKFGILAFIFAVVTSYIVKFIFGKIELLYLTKVALNLSFISLSFLILMVIMMWIGTTLPLSVAVFPLLVMSTLSEKFTATKSEEGLRAAIFGVIETLGVVIVSYYMIHWSSFNSLIISWPEFILVPLVLIILLGKFSGLRISEYIRFRSLLSDHKEE